MRRFGAMRDRGARRVKRGAALLCVIAALGLTSLAHGAGLLDGIARDQNGDTRRVSSSHEDLNRNGDARSIAPGETLVLGELDGPGVVTHIWCTVASADPFYPRALVLRAYWDGAETPSIEAPLGDFFGVGHGALAEFESLPVAVSSEGRARNCFWPMPFKHSARITVTNESEEHRTDSFYYYLDWRKLDEISPESYYFHARYRQAMPAKPGDYTILNIEGKGHYVGTVYSAQMMETGWFGEGDDRFYIDGEDTPSMRGTGTEDYFNDAWGFRAFDTPLHGVSLWEGYFPGDRVTAYRWHLDSPVTFDESLKVTIEHKGSIFTDRAQFLGQFIERPDWVSSVAFWYQESPAGAGDRMPPLDERLPPYRVLNAADLAHRAEPPQMITKGDGGVTYIPGRTDAAIEFDFGLEEAGRYRLDAFLTYGIMSGVYQVLLDGTPVGSAINFCQTGQDILPTRLDVHDLDAGTHTLRFEGRGAPPNKRSLAPDYYGLGFYRLILLRMEDMAGYREALEKAQQER